MQTATLLDSHFLKAGAASATPFFLLVSLSLLRPQWAEMKFQTTELHLLTLPEEQTLNDSTNASKAPVLQIKSVLLHSLCTCRISFQNQSDWHYLICTRYNKSILHFSPVSTQGPNSQMQLKREEIGAWVLGAPAQDL